MKCFQFYIGEKKDEAKTSKSISVQSFDSTFTERETRQSGSELNSRNVSDISTESTGRASFPNLSQKSSNLRVFTFSDLKVVTRNFSRSTKIGEGGFGCVYKGVIKISEDPKKLDVAVKQLGKRGLQARFPTLCFFPFNLIMKEFLPICILPDFILHFLASNSTDLSCSILISPFNWFDYYIGEFLFLVETSYICLLFSYTMSFCLAGAQRMGDRSQCSWGS